MSLIRVALLFFTVFIYACSEVGNTGDLTGSEIIIKFGKPVLLVETGKSITFTEVNESRCPIGVNCVWEGVVEVHLEYDNETYNFSTLNDSTKKAEIDGYEILLLSVEPYPEYEVHTAKEDYKTTISFMKM